MAPGTAFAVNGLVGDYGRGLTASVMITCIVAASGGLIYGYDIGISGGVTTMAPFLKKFFPTILVKVADAKTTLYCRYNSQTLTAFTSSLYIAGLASSLIASRLTATFGRRNIMLLGGCLFLAGGAINGGAENIFMLILGRILLGFGVGFTNQATPVYLSEMAPPKWRGALSNSFGFFISLGIVAANCVNYGATRLSWGWRLSLALAGLPAIIMTLGALLISDTPSSLVERGKLEQAKQSLIKVRGIGTDIEPELSDLIRSSEIAKAVNQEPFATILERQYRPHLVLAIAIPFFQQTTGIKIFAFYAPILFQSVGFGHDSAFLAAIVVGLVEMGSILASSTVVDRFGRRFLFLVGGILMFICQVSVACVLAAVMGLSDTNHISKGYGILVLILMCLYVTGFGCSWGTLTWLIPSEIFPLKIRTTGQSISIAINFATTFVLSQTFLTMLCHFKFATFLFYAGWIFVMTIFIMFFLPETKGIPLNSMYVVWEGHWYWGRFVKAQSSSVIP
ncbi:sugar transport protein 5-like [Rhododendron vialii]|uniref:sugar transport protein 5-like n=1 Tax=Rhododendron vialii TaxID=182163 RepID=UPI00265E5484|nr:sugar transport protein 5-like [Rhododendron vialii]